MARHIPRVGSIAPNPHEGSRSEYLAQYVFSSFGTSIPVPHQEDSGIDLHCTWMERIGQNAWPRHYYAVQVKSTDDPWHFSGEESVRWFIEFPLPFFFCIVTKKEARLRVFHTSPRFYVWSLPPHPTACTLTPGDGTQGRCTQWEGGHEFSLSAPILDFTIPDSLDEDFHQRIREVLEHWIQVDECNLYQIRSGLRQFAMPYSYITNEVPGGSGTVVQGIGTAPAGDLAVAVGRIADQLEWVTRQLHQAGDLAGALRGALFFRHLFPDQVPITLTTFFHVINQHLGHAPPSYLLQGLDEMNRLIQERFPNPTPPEIPPTFGSKIHPPER